MTRDRSIGAVRTSLKDCVLKLKGRISLDKWQEVSGAPAGGPRAEPLRASPSSGGAPDPGLTRRLVAVAVALVLVVGGVWTALGTVDRAPASATNSIGFVQALYAQDMVARINAERGARSSASVPVPQLSVDPGLQADAQAWSAHIAAVGTVSDPSLPPCTGPGGAAPSPSQVCVFAANSGSTGYGFWPGDGSDGMDGAYMASTYHRQNELGAAYNLVGVGVTCADNQAWTVELYGCLLYTSDAADE